MSVDDSTFEQALAMAQQLPPVDQARLIARLAPAIEKFLEHVEKPELPERQVRMRGLLADLGAAPSTEEIDEVQHEMWASFAEDKR
ncbi:MAG: hypothetical protein AB1757_08825 [Acidobacteriota bacterium]